MEAPKEEKKAPTVEDMASYDFMTVLPMFNEKIEELSNRQLKRVTSALMEYPLMDRIPSFAYAQERELFNMGCKLIDCKHVIMKAAMEIHKEEIEKAIAEKMAKVEGEDNESV